VTGQTQPVLLFPGQTSRNPRLWDWPRRALPRLATGLLAQACELLGRDLLAHYHHENDSIFATNRDVQVGVFIANHLHLLLLEEAGVRTPWSIGFSLGEYNHLVHIGALSFADALRLVDRRGAIYDEGPEGSMAAVFPLPLAELLPVVDDARAAGVVEVVLYNSPTQHVIAGERAAVERAIELLDERCFVQARVIEPRIAMHSSVFAPAARALRGALEACSFQPTEHPYMPNVLGEPVRRPRPEQLIDLLARHACEPVRWQASIEIVCAALDGQAVLVEAGPGRQLTSLLRRWQPVAAVSTESEESFEQALAALRAGASLGA